MTTDTKAVARWEIGHYEHESSPSMVESDVGMYVHIDDHEQAVSLLSYDLTISLNSCRAYGILCDSKDEQIAELRSALAAKTAEVEGLLGALQVAELALRERGLRACAEYKEIESALAKAMEKSNEHQDQ